MCCTALWQLVSTRAASSGGGSRVFPWRPFRQHCFPVDSAVTHAVEGLLSAGVDVSGKTPCTEVHAHLVVVLTPWHEDRPLAGSTSAACHLSTTEIGGAHSLQPWMFSQQRTCGGKAPRKRQAALLSSGGLGTGARWPMHGDSARRTLQNAMSVTVCAYNPESRNL